MKKCSVTITSSVDGRENSFHLNGEMELSAFGATLHYKDGEAFVSLELQGEKAEIERNGDYTLKICLERGRVCNGVLGIGGNEGAIQSLAHKISYSVKDGSLLAVLHYDLLLGDEPQKMKLRIMARAKE